MGEWKETTLGDISQDINYGYTASAKQECIGPKFLRITDIANGQLKWEEVPFCKISDIDRKKYKLDTGDIVIARTGATTGATYTIKPRDPEDVVFASYLIRYRINRSIADPFFIDFCLRSSSWKSYIEGIAGGSAQPGANAQQLATYKILLPPLPEQKAIAEVLSSLDDKIDLLHRQNKTLEALAETLFRQWFVEGAREEWEDGVLGDVISICSGKGLNRSSFKEDGLYPVLGANGEIGRANEYLFDEKLIYTGRVGTLGNIFVNKGKAWLSDNTLVINPVISEYFYFIYFFLKNAELGSYNVGSTQPLIRQSEIKELELQIPPIDLIRNFSTLSENIFVKIDQNKNQIQSLEKLRDVLLPKLMSGEVRVKSEVLESQDNVIYISDYIKSIKEKSKKSCEEKGFVDIKKIAGDCNIIVLKDISVKKAQIRYENPHYIIHANDLTDSFSIAHELAHYVQDRETIKKQAVGRKDEFSLTESKEKEIDSLAAEFVMPEEYIRAFIDNNIKNKNIVIGNKLISKCAKQFRVNPPAVQFRLNNLGYKTTNKH